MAEKFIDKNNRDEFVDALADLLTDNVCHTKHKQGCLAPNCRDCIDRFFDMCSHLLPEVDVEPIVHGQWVRNEGYDKRDNFYKCSVCGRSINVICGETLTDYPYCHCGAKMEEERK